MSRRHRSRSRVTQLGVPPGRGYLNPELTDPENRCIYPRCNEFRASSKGFLLPWCMKHINAYADTLITNPPTEEETPQMETGKTTLTDHTSYDHVYEWWSRYPGKAMNTAQLTDQYSKDWPDAPGSAVALLMDRVYEIAMLNLLTDGEKYPCAYRISRGVYVWSGSARKHYRYEESKKTMVLTDKGVPIRYVPVPRTDRMADIEPDPDLPMVETEDEIPRGEIRHVDRGSPQEGLGAPSTALHFLSGDDERRVYTDNSGNIWQARKVDLKW